MFIVVLTYIRPQEEVAAARQAHLDFLADFYTAGYGIASGRKVEGDGGVIVATAPSRAALDAELAKDPFKIQGLADYEIHEFTPGRLRPELEGLA